MIQVSKSFILIYTHMKFAFLVLMSWLNYVLFHSVC